MEQLGVEGFYDAMAWPTAKRLLGWHVLGRGYRGVVFLGRWRGKTVALKLRRADAVPGASLLAEAAALALANGVQLGPTLWSASEGCLVMDSVMGDRLIDWVYREPTKPGYPSNAEVSAVLLQLAEAGFRLDQLGLDHGELSCVASHAMVCSELSGAPEAVMIDFGQASLERRACNVTAMIQGLLIGTSIPQALARRFVLPGREVAIAPLRAYKRFPSPETFAEVRSLVTDLPEILKT
ncbi:MAG: serine/threonine protein kinase [Synechococcales cyanobacterium CRU_2_2]|nr:serine/threonine protein kinase [Synechococcales cyanobacterium CRU_2_2]